MTVFVKSVNVFALILLLVGCASRPHRMTEGFPVVQGLTSETSAEFTVMAPKNRQVKFTVATPHGETLQPEKVEEVSRPHSPWTLYKLHFGNLAYDPGTFRLFIHDGIGNRDERNFHLFSNQGEKLRFVIGSCADARHASLQAAAWSSIAKQKPEWLFMIGDNVYAAQEEDEVQSPDVLWDRYVEGRLAMDLFFWRDLVPVYTVWDDNDYGQKDGNSSYALKTESESIFKAFWAQSYGADLYEPGPGVAGRLALRGMHFSFLDNRSFRDVSPEGEHFGHEQEEWLFSDLQKSDLPTWIISGDQFFGGFHKSDSYEGTHPKAFENFLTRLRTVTTPFVFVSGDRHMTEIMQFPRALFGQLSFEFTSSPFHGKTYPGRARDFTNPWRVVAHDETNNYLLIDTWLEPASWEIKAQAMHDETPLFQRELSLTTEALKDFKIEKRQRRRRYRRARFRRGRKR